MKQRVAQGDLLGRALVKERRREKQLRGESRLAVVPEPAALPRLEGRPIDVPREGTLPAHKQFVLRGQDYRYTEQRWTKALKESTLVTLDGHGCSIRVERGELILKPGGSYLGERPQMKLVRGLHSTSAIVILGASGASGALTLQAIQWCAAQKIALFAIDRAGELTSIVSIPATYSAALHRLQHKASPLKLAREIVKAKIEAGMQVRPAARDRMAAFLPEIDRARSIAHIRMLEANAAIWYWRAWHFPLKTAGRHFPDHWRDFDQRGSAISVTQRKATHPINGMLNYGYAILAAQIRRALEVRGFDACLGTLHADFEGRPSLVYDLIELLRSEMDNQLLTWAKNQTWRRTDFVVDSEGVVRLHSTLARVVVQKAALAERKIADVVQWYGRRIEILCA